MTPFMENKLAVITEMASAFDSRLAFKQSHPAEYKWLQKYGLINVAMPNLPREGVWSYEKVLAAAKSSPTRSFFYEKQGGAVNWARSHGCLDEIVQHIPTSREATCPKSAKNAALECSTRFEFYKKFTRYYSWCVRNGVLDQYCAHMESPITNWTVDQVSDLAKPFQYKKDFERAHPNAYRWAYRSGVIEKISEHMDACSTTSDYDCVYMWAPAGFPDVFKVGVTSMRLGDARIREVASRGGLQVESVVTANVTDARKIEAKLLSLGQSFCFGRVFTGSTEFRFYLPEALEQCMDIMRFSDSSRIAA